jgi:flagellar hook-associated protein 2
MRIGGLVAGIDTSELVQQLMAIERRPVLAMQVRQDTIKTKTDAWRDVATRLSSLRSKAAALKSAAAINIKTATSSDSSILTATASAGAINGVYRIWIDRVATSTRVTGSQSLGQPLNIGERLSEAGFATAPTVGWFTINGKVVTIDQDTVMSDGVDDASSNSVIGRINSSGAGVVASVVNNRLVLRAPSGSIQLGAGGDTSNFLSAAKVLGGQIAATITSGVAEHSENAGAVASDVAAGATITFTYDGVEYTTAESDISGAAAGITSLADLAFQISQAMNRALGDSGSVLVSVVDGEGPGEATLVVQDGRTGGTLAITSATDSGLGCLLEQGGATSGSTITSYGNLGVVKAGAALYTSRLAGVLNDSVTSGVAEGATEGTLAVALVGTETVTFRYHGEEYTTEALSAGDDMAAVAADLEAKMNAAAGLDPGTIRVKVSGLGGAQNDMFVITDTATPEGSTANSITVSAAPKALGLAASDGGTNRGLFVINGVAIQYDRYSDSLTSVINRINASSAQVTAAYDTLEDRLVLTAKYTGSISISSEDVGGGFLGAAGILGATQVPGENALFRVDTVNGGTQLSSASNTVSGIIPGVTLELKEAGENASTITVSQNVDAGYSAIKSFVDQYNSVLDLISSLTSYNSTTKSAGTLQANGTVLGIASRLRTLAMETVSGLPAATNSLLAIGISTGAIGSTDGRSGKLVIDDAKLKAALTSNPEGVTKLFSEPNTGIAARFDTYISGLVQAGTGLIPKTQANLDAEAKMVSRRITDAERRLEVREATLIKQFTAMEKALSSMRSQSAWLNTQFTSMW